MPRRLRVEIAGGVYHVFNRGVEKRDIVKDDVDRKAWFQLFSRAAIRCRWRVYAVVLMRNHFHVFLKTPDPNLSTGMHDIESSYATLFNKRHSRTGHLFESRFHSILVEGEGYGWSLSRYLHLNPCRAKIVSKPETFRWSTYRFFLNPTGAPEWLDWRTVLCEFSGTEAAARVAYRRYVESAVSLAVDNPLDAAVEGLLLGSDQFVARHRQLIEDTEVADQRHHPSPDLNSIVDAAAEIFQVTTSEILSRGRHINLAREAAVWFSRQMARVPLKQFSEQFGVSSSTISETVRRCECRQTKSSEFRAQCELLREIVLEKQKAVRDDKAE